VGTLPLALSSIHTAEAKSDVHLATLSSPSHLTPEAKYEASYSGLGTTVPQGTAFAMIALSVTWALFLVALLVTIVIVVAGCDNRRHNRRHKIRASQANIINRNGNNEYLRDMDLGGCRHYHPIERQGYRHVRPVPMGIDDNYFWYGVEREGQRADWPSLGICAACFSNTRFPNIAVVQRRHHQGNSAGPRSGFEELFSDRGSSHNRGRRGRFPAQLR
jgi:hypothetical protein